MSLLRIPRVLDITGESRSAFYAKIARGLMVQPVKIGQRASAIPSAEVDALITAKTGGATDDQIRQLVERLHAQRATAAAKVLAGA